MFILPGFAELISAANEEPHQIAAGFNFLHAGYPSCPGADPENCFGGGHIGLGEVWGGSLTPPSRLGSLGEHRKLPQQGLQWSPATNDFRRYIHNFV